VTFGTIELLENAYISPLSHLTMPQGGARGRFDGGIYYSDGSVCERGRHKKKGYDNIPGGLERKVSVKLSGAHLFGGLLHRHFGHFLVESISRVWAAELVKSVESIVFIPRVNGKQVPGFATALFREMGVDLPLTLIDSTTQVERLWVLEQLIEPDILMLAGHPFVKTLARRLGAKKEGLPKRLYVSRAGLPLHQGSILFEALLEEALSKQGYVVIRPETLSLSEQLDLYYNAEDLIFAEGSAIHLYALVANTRQKSFIVWRRSKPRPAFERQLISFGASPPTGTPCVVREYYQNISAGTQNKTFTLLDFDRLSAELRAAGFIERTLDGPSADDIGRELVRIDAELGKAGRKLVVDEAT